MIEDRSAPPPPPVVTTPPRFAYGLGRPTWFWIVLIGGCCAALFLVLIVAAIAIPQFLKVKNAASQAAAIQTLRTISSAEVNYYASYPDSGYACSLPALGGDPAAGGPTPQAAQLIDPALAASGQKNGYTFALTCNSKTSYKLTAVPQQVGRTGDRGYCSDESNDLKFDPNGGTNCAELLQ